MPKAILEDNAPVGDVIPDDTWLLAEVSSVRGKDINRKDGTIWTKWVWKFLVIEDGSEYDARAVYGETDGSFKMSSDNVAYQWVSEILATELPKGFELDTDDLLGMTCRINVGIREYEKNGEIRQLNEVVNVLRASRPETMEAF